IFLIDRVDEERPTVLQVGNHHHADDAEDELTPAPSQRSRSAGACSIRCRGHFRPWCFLMRVIRAGMPYTQINRRQLHPSRTLPLIVTLRPPGFPQPRTVVTSSLRRSEPLRRPVADGLAAVLPLAHKGRSVWSWEAPLGKPLGKKTPDAACCDRRVPGRTAC